MKLTDAQIKGHQKLFIAEALPALTQAMDALSEIAYGPPMQKWREVLMAGVPGCNWKSSTKMTWSDFEAQTKNTLQAVDTRTLIGAIFKAHTAFNALSERHTRAALEMDQETKDVATALIHKARVTLQEAFFCESIVKAKVDMAKAITELQGHVRNMQALPEGQRIKPSELWPLVWATAMSVQSGVLPS